jgi:hypothetical protein
LNLQVTRKTLTEGAEMETPIACTLDEAGFATQAERWTALLADHGTGRTEAEEGLRLAFRDEPRVAAELEALVAVENRCCAWASWDVAHEGGEVVMWARSTGDGVATLHGMFVRDV